MPNQRIAVVTGASSGFGRLTAQAFAADGWRAYGTMRNSRDRNAKAAAELQAAGVAVVDLDVTSDASVDAAARTILEEAGHVDVLVNNAGTGLFGVQEAFTPAAAERQFATNVFGPLRVNRAFLPAMRERKSGLIVYVSSVVGRIIVPFGGIYTASKWALEALAETSAYELAPFGVEVAIVQPGAYATEIVTKATSADDTARVRSYGEVAVLFEQRIGALLASAEGRDPQDVATAVLRLANQAPGSRQFRTVVPENPAAEAINASIAPIQAQVAESFGYEALLAKTPA